MIPKNKETSGQIRRAKFKIPFQVPNLSKTTSSFPKNKGTKYSRSLCSYYSLFSVFNIKGVGSFWQLTEELPLSY